MSYTIAIAGKGGSGKTTICGLIISELLQQGKRPLLAVDADPNANLADVLGIKVLDTVGNLREESLGSLTTLPAGMTKSQFLEYRLQQALVEGTGFDLLVMGRPEGPGCYCYANNIIRCCTDILSDNYSYVIIDNEAGMEHLSRRTTRNIDLLLIVSDGSQRGLSSAQRIFQLTQKLQLNIKTMRLIITRRSNEPPNWQQLISTELPLAGLIPDDNLAAQYDVAGTPLVELPASSSARKAVSSILKQLDLI